MTKKIILKLLIILLPIIIITASVDSVIFNKKYYLRYENQVDNKEEVIINLLDYFNNNKELIEQKGFTNEEKLHFLDVKKIIRTIRSILLLSLMMAAMLFVYLFAETKNGKLRTISSYIINGSLITIIIVIFIYLSSQNFNYFFTLFHSLLFKAGTWIFPADSLSIRLFPIELFRGFAKNILTRMIIVSLSLLSIGIIHKKLSKKVNY